MKRFEMKIVHYPYYLSFCISIGQILANSNLRGLPAKLLNSSFIDDIIGRIAYEIAGEIPAPRVQTAG